VQLYVGRAKGKTTAAVGLLVRAAGRGLRGALIQFGKRASSSGEHFVLQGLDDRITVHCFGMRPGAGGWGRWITRGRPTEEALKLARDALEATNEAASSGEYDIVVGDELLYALDFGLIGREDIESLLKRRARQTELVLTGDSAPRWLVEAADLVTQMRKLKHPYDSGLQAREGIEF
jgi:cob(I)alamin adenosyltransferase